LASSHTYRPNLPKADFAGKRPGFSYHDRGADMPWTVRVEDEEGKPHGESFVVVEFGSLALRLNQRPRKTLGFETPASKLQASVASTG
jgi:hypothetical protein